MPRQPLEDNCRWTRWRPRCTLWWKTPAGIVLAMAVLFADSAAVAQTRDEAPRHGSNDRQTSSDASSGDAKERSQPPVFGGAIQYVGPDTYILLDEDGRPQPVPGMTYEDFMAAWKQSQKLDTPERQPRFTIESVQIEGRVEGRLTELRFNTTVHLLADGAVDVPLGLLGAVLQDTPEFKRMDSNSNENDGAPDDNRNGRSNAEPIHAYAAYDPHGGGFVAHFNGRRGQRYSMSLSLLVPLTNDGSGTTLSLTSPRAVFSKLTLDVNSPVAEATAIGGTLIGKETTAGSTRLSVAGVMGPFRLTWQTSEAKTDELATVLSAEGAVRIAIDGRSVRSDARLTVRSYGGSFDRFRIRLPRGAQLIQRQPTEAASQAEDYRISLEEPATTGGPATTAGPQIVLVELPEPQRGPVVVDLTTEQPLGLDDDLSAQLEGFEVVGAVRQFGDLALMVAGDWQTRWTVGRYVRQVDHDEIEPSLQSPEVTAAFQYDRQPWTIGLRIAARQFRVLVTPSYELECTPDEAQLTVRLTYQVMGARAFAFQVRLEGWEVLPDPLESGGLVDRDQMSVDDGVLTLPLVQGSSRRADVAFKLSRPLPRDESRLRIPLPVPVADSVGSGQLLVRPAAGMNLLPDVPNSVGLAPVAMVDSPPSAPGDEANEFRFRCMAPEVLFAAQRVRRAREVQNEVAIEASIDQTEARVAQSIQYSVRYEGIVELEFEAPVGMPLQEGEIEFVEKRTDGSEVIPDNVETPLSWTSLNTSTLNASAAARRIRVSLPQPRLGEFSVEARYRVRKPSGNAATKAWNLPLLRPTESPSTSTRAEITVPSNASVAIAPKGNTSWRRMSPTHSQAGTIAFRAERPEMYLPCVLSAASLNSAPATNVERIWLQTWIATGIVQERAAFRLSTPAPRVAIELAPQTPQGEVEVLVDRRPATIISREQGQLIVQLAPDRGERERPATSPLPYTLELRYRRPFGSALITRHLLTPPQIVGTTSLSEVYWQIILPGDQHIIRSPSQLAAAAEWQWLGSFWRQRPTLSQAELEQWCGASTQLAPSPAQNEYAFTGMAPLSSIRLITAPRWLLVLAASGGVLALTLLWIYAPAVRRGWIVAIFACGLAVSAFAFPQAAMLVGQAAVLGVALAILATLMYWVVARPASWTIVTSPTATSQRHSTARPESIAMPPLVATASTAPTMSVRAADSQ